MDDARRKILERRSRFVAAAISTIAIGCERPPPQPCLSPIAPDDIGSGPDDAAPDASTAAEDATTYPHPSVTTPPCLTPMPNPPDAGPPKPDAATPDAKPHPCLKVAPPKKDAGPHVCLDFAE